MSSQGSSPLLGALKHSPPGAHRADAPQHASQARSTLALVAGAAQGLCCGAASPLVRPSLASTAQAQRVCELHGTWCGRLWHERHKQKECVCVCVRWVGVTAHTQVAARLEAAVDNVLDQGLRTKDIYKEGQAGTKLVKCSEMGDALLKVL